MHLTIYDRDVSLARLFGANKQYIEREIPHIAELMRESIDDVLASSEVIVIGNKADAFRQIEERTRNHTVIDLVRIFGERRTGENYQGICW